MHRSTFSLPAGRLARAALLAGGLALAATVAPTAASAAVVSSTNTMLTSSPNPSATGQDVTFTATVSSDGGTPTGTVTFSDTSSGATLGTATLDSSGTAAITTGAGGVPSLAAGSHAITATYSGDPNFTVSESSALTQVVNQGNTTTTLTPSANPSAAGQDVTFTATVSPNAPATGTPTGTVTFRDLSSGATLGTATLDSSGTAAITTGAGGVPSLAGGSHAIQAAYNGDSNFAPGFAGLTQVVVVAPTAITLTSSPNPSAAGQYVTFTATVSSGAGTPTGTVTFFDGSTALGTATLDLSGAATLTTSLPNAGSHLITASYGGAADFAASTSNTVAQVVYQGTTTTRLFASPGTSVGGQGITFTATTSPVLPAAGTPTGSVTFFDGGTPFYSANLVNGTVTITTGAGGVPSLATGSHAITATYNGDSNFAASTSSTLTEIVVSALSITTTSLPGGTVGSAYSQTLAATGGVTPYTWSVSSGSLPAGLTLDSSTGTISGTPTAAGTSTFSVTATDSGTQPRQTATQSFIITIAGVADLAVSISGPPKPVQQSKPVTLTITVQNLGPYASQGVVLTDAVPSGAQFVNGTASQGSCTTPSAGSAGVVSCSLGTLASGATAKLTLTIDPVIKSGTISDTATVSADTADPDPANNSATVVIQVK